MIACEVCCSLLLFTPLPGTHASLDSANGEFYIGFFFFGNVGVFISLPEARE